MSLLQATIIAYILGSIPFGYLLTKYGLKIDIRNIGSGNIGATNVLRTGNKLLALHVLLLDFLKGFLFLYIIKQGFDISQQSLIALAAVCGHIFPIWLRFKGGKGVATALGVYLAALPYYALTLACIWLLMLSWKKISGLSAIIMFISAIPLIFLFNIGLDAQLIILIINILVLIRHNSNLVELLKPA